MPDFVFKGISSSGQRRAGRLEAENREIAIELIKKRGLTPISVNEVGSAAGPRNAPGLGGISVSHLAIFTRKFAQLTKTDMPLTVALDVLADEEENTWVREAVEHVGNRISQGADLETSMSERPRVFSKLYIKMIQSGMKSGTLDLVADNLAKLYETESAIRKQMIGKLAYPVALLGFCFLAGVVLRMVNFITPVLFALLQSFWVLIAILVVFGMTRVGYGLYREIGFRLPGIGALMRNINLARFCRIFGIQYAAGVPVLEGLDVAREVLQDGRLENAIVTMKRHINNGVDLRDAFAKTGVFPKRVVGMVGVGEKGGGVDLMLEKLAEYYELDISTQTSILTTVIYFAVYLAVAITIGIMVISGWSSYFGIINSLINET
jgi:type II secretory pathway component PulF